MKFLFDNPIILAYATGQPHAVGGAERQQWLLARALARKGHEVVVYSRMAPVADGGAKERIIDGVVFKQIMTSGPLLAWPRMLARERPDWWYWRCSDYYLGILVPLAHAYGVKVAFACAFDTDCLPQLALTRRRYLWPLYGLGLWTADRILVQHEGQRRLLPGKMQPKAFWVPSIAGVNPPSGRREDYIAWVGVLRETKRPHLLLEIAKKLPNFHFVACGPVSAHRTRPGYAEEVVRNFQEAPNINYLGRVSSAEAERVIGHAALFLSTSDKEGLPNTFLQAMGLGVPVVSLELDPGELIANSAGGVVAPDMGQCAQAIVQLLEDRSLNEQVGLHGQSYVAQGYNEEEAVERLLAALG
jgi:glycosyltransferase involved in cell wall biosynthesis